MSGEQVRVSSTQAAVLNLLARCESRLGKSELPPTDWSIDLDLWYNYYNERPRIEKTLLLHVEALSDLDLVERATKGYRLTAAGRLLNQQLSQKAEAHATALWEDSDLCKIFRRDLYGRQMQILSGQTDPTDVPLFNVLSDQHAEAIDQRLQTLTGRHESLNILDFGCGVISRIPELLMQRNDMKDATVCFVDQDPRTLDRLQKKHQENPRITVVKSHYESLPERDLGLFELILAIDILYFVPNDADARASTIQALFEKLVVGGLLIFSLGAAPKLSPEEIAVTSEALLPIDHPRSGLHKIMATLAETPHARVNVLTEPYSHSWDQFALAFARTPVSRDAGLERLRFETAQVMKKLEVQKDIPAGRWTVFVEKV